MGSEELLKQNINEFLEEAERTSKSGSFNTAATIYFKALAVIADLFILRQKGFIPKNHAERFRILEESYMEIYILLNRDFPIYQQSYRIKLTREHSEVLKKDVKQLVKLTNLEDN